MGNTESGFGSERATFLLLVGVALGTALFGAIGNGVLLSKNYANMPEGDAVVSLLWACGTVAALVSGSVGLFLVLKTGRIRQHVLYVFLLLMSISIQSPGWRVDVVPVGATFRLGWDGYQVGLNFVGIAGAFWYFIMSA